MDAIQDQILQDSAALVGMGKMKASIPANEGKWWTLAAKHVSFCVTCWTLSCVTPLAGAEWNTEAADSQRSFRVREPWPSGRLVKSWSLKQANPPQPAWPGPAKWDAYIHLRGLRNMPDYDHPPKFIVAEERLYFSNVVDDSIPCHDIASGREVWCFTCDGPIRMARTYFDGRVFFACTHAKMTEALRRVQSL